MEGRESDSGGRRRWWVEGVGGAAAVLRTAGNSGPGK